MSEHRHERCPSADCWGQFAILNNVGLICTGWIAERMPDEQRELYRIATQRHLFLAEVVRAEGAAQTEGPKT